jgi:NTP pyrophosphatase (non-canonical NTP hydrolase)
MGEITELTNKLIEFRDARDWVQFHNPKDLALAINVEAGELLECFLWKQPQDADKEKVKEELADVISFALLLANQYGLDNDLKPLYWLDDHTPFLQGDNVACLDYSVAKEGNMVAHSWNGEQKLDVRNSGLRRQSKIATTFRSWININKSSGFSQTKWVIYFNNFG